MSAVNNGGPAFPGLNAEFTGISSEGRERFEIQPSGGMTLRDYFAANAMQSLVSADVSTISDARPGETVGEWISRKAYSIADLMLQAREAA